MDITSAASLQKLPGFPAASATQRRILKTENDGFRTPLFHNQDALAVLKRWLTECEKSQNVGLEKAEFAKVGPFYNYKFETWSAKVDAYFNHSEENQPSPRLLEMMDRYHDWLSSHLRGQIASYKIQDVYDRSRKNTNLGYPHVSSDWSKVDSYLARAQRILDGEQVELFPYVMFKRVQPGGFDRTREDRKAKQRPVWGSDHAETFASLSFVYPLIDTLKEVPGFEHLKGIDFLESALSSRGSEWGWFCSLDFSACDATFGPQLIAAGMYLMGRLVNIEGPSSVLFDYYTRGSLHAPDGLRSGVHGIPSGIGVTNMIETLVLRALIGCYIEDQGLGSFDQTWQNGDDGLIMTNEPIATHHLAEYLKTFGLVLNADKSLVDKDEFSYLQRHHYRDQGFTAVMSTMRMLGRILYAEHAVTMKSDISPSQYWTLNAIMKLENCKRSDIFQRFVDFVANGDKYIGSVVTEIGEGSLQTFDIRLITGYSVFGDDLSRGGLGDFESIRYLQSGLAE